MRVVSLSKRQSPQFYKLQSLTLYSSVMELPADAYDDFQYWLLRDSGIGAGAGAIEHHFADVTARVADVATGLADGRVEDATKRTEEVADALALLHYSYNDTLDRLNPKHLAFGCLVAEFNGKPWVDRTEEGLRRLLHKLSEAGLTAGQVAEEVERAKKDLRRN